MGVVLKSTRTHMLSIDCAIWQRHSALPYLCRRVLDKTGTHGAYLLAAAGGDGDVSSAPARKRDDKDDEDPTVSST